MAFDLSVLENNDEFEIPKEYKMLTFSLDLTNELPKVELPMYYEIWNWEGDLQPLPNKWYKLIKSCFGSNFCQLKGINDDSYLVKKYVSNTDSFDPESFYFITTRSEFCATGFGWYEDKEKKIGKLHWLAVDKNHRQIGLGKYVVLLICQKMKTIGIEKCVLKTESFRTNAISLYEKLGFKMINEEDVILKNK